MISYYLKCKKNTENKNPKVVKTKNLQKKCIHQNVQCLKVKNQDLSKSKKLIP